MSALIRSYLSTTVYLRSIDGAIARLALWFQAKVVWVDVTEEGGRAIALTASSSVYAARLPNLRYQEPFMLHACRKNGIKFCLCCELAEFARLSIFGTDRDRAIQLRHLQ